MEQNMPTSKNAQVFPVAKGVWGKRDLFVNFYFVEGKEPGKWVLVDAGLKWSGSEIITIANDLFGPNNQPAAIILTHGHFDHVGSLETLLAHWSVPVYAHQLELPYLTGLSSYPPPDPTVGGGIMSTLSFLYPSSAIDLGKNIKPLPYNGSIPGFPEWKYIETPGHSPGHISLFREEDRLLLSGDALTTTKPESGLSTIFQSKRLSGPPQYFTYNWASARFSVLKLEALKPAIIASGHGKPMQGQEVADQLSLLSRHFYELAVPRKGRYVNQPAVINESGVAFLPKERKSNSTAFLVLGATALIVSAFVTYKRRSGNY